MQHLMPRFYEFNYFEDLQNLVFWTFGKTTETFNKVIILHNVVMKIALTKPNNAPGSLFREQILSHNDNDF